MSGITSVVAPLFETAAQGLVQHAARSSLQSQFDRAANQQKAASDALQEQQAADNAALQKSALQSKADADSDTRLRQLRAGLAKARAHFAAQGIGPDDGSAANLQETAFANSADEQQFADDDLSNRMAQLDQTLGNIQARNLLQRSQTKNNQLLGYLHDAVF